MELHERLTNTNPLQVAPASREPFADLKNAVHMQVISELGPQLSGAAVDPAETREHVMAAIRHRLQTETGISRSLGT